MTTEATVINEAIRHYHHLLENASLANQAQARLTAGTDTYNLKFGSRAICSVLRPFFVTSDYYATVMEGSRLVVGAIRKLGRALLTDSSLRAQVDLSAEEEQLIAIEPGFSTADASGRLDAFLDSQGGFHFVEYNAESPGGLLYGDCLSDIFLEMDVVREFANTYPVRRVPIRPLILQTLLTCYREWGGSGSPQIAIVDWNEVSTRAEFVISREYFESQGFRTVIADPDELEIHDGRLRAGDFRVDLVYKRVVTGELLQRSGLEHPLVSAVRQGAACVVNSFRVQMLFKKVLFALLDDPENERLFAPDEIRAIRAHIPWTRRLSEGFTTYSGRRVDLVEFALANQDRMVLKPNSDYGGRGVTLGWDCTSERWEQAIKDALGASFVIQERVEVREESFPRLIDGNVSVMRHYVDFDPYSWAGDDVEGAGVRLSSSALLNVTSGGGSATPMLIIDRN